MSSISDHRISGRKTTTNKQPKPNLIKTLRNSWYKLRLSVRHPIRVPTWDAIVLTAASPEQARLYNWQLDRAKRLGRIAPDTVTLAVPDPDGCRIGSGAATLNAVWMLALHFADLGVSRKTDSSSTERFESGISHLPYTEYLAKKHILLLHAGGDSKRVPWANPMGKVFLPLPYLAGDDPDAPVHLLFDHILAISSCARQAFKDEGGLFIMTGDVLPCFDASSMVLPEDASCIITVPITLDIASNHGVIVASESGLRDAIPSASLVENLLQKPSLEELVEGQALLDDGRALLDTGIIAVRGEAWKELVDLACSSQSLILELLKSKNEMSLYEDLVAAWVPTKHEWLKNQPMGREMVDKLGRHRLFSYCAHELQFLHFGTSTEVLDHLSGIDSGLVGRRHLCSIPATTEADIAASAIVLSSKIAPGVSVGEDSLIYDSSISNGVQIGSLSIVVGLNVPRAFDETVKVPINILIPDRHCIWEVPLVGSNDKVIVYCGLHDNPKTLISKNGTFCGRPWDKVLHDLCIQESDLWSSVGPGEKCLWNAKIFPVLPYLEMLQLASWLMGTSDPKSQSMHHLWKSSPRMSLEVLHRSIDFQKMCSGSSNHQADLAVGITRACISFGLLGRNISQLCNEIQQMELSGAEICKDFLAICPSLEVHSSKLVPKSRVYQVKVDLLRACGDGLLADELEQKVWASVADETASAVRYGFREHLSDESRGEATSAIQGNKANLGAKEQNFRRSVKVELPVRVDFVGGWSDTPPWSLERAGCVLNMAICLEGSLPIGTIIETTKTPGVLITDDVSNKLFIPDPSSIVPPFDNTDPFRLVKCALLVTGVVHDDIVRTTGLEIKTWANVPRGSGLGTSSILAAAVVKALIQILDGNDGNENIARLVLVLEQLMGTGGGWQDQIGGLYPGIKFTTSFPGIPLRLQVIQLLSSPQLISQLQQRLLVVFTGQVRLARKVLQNVVIRYLRRDNLLVSSIKRLAEMARIGREALMNGDIDELGDIMTEAWRLHQELDPFCSDKSVDQLFEFADPYCRGYKLVGAGGGGFALLLAKDKDNADKLRHLLTGNSDFNVKVYDWSIYLDS